MSQELSRYRLRAREIITSVMANLPQDATEKDARKALRKAKPDLFKRGFPGDGRSWISQCWFREQRDALRKRFHPPPMTTAPTITYRLRWLPRGSWNALRFLPWLTVVCQWCEGETKTRAGCLLCGPHHEAIEAAVKNPEFLALRQAASYPEDGNPDYGDVGVLCDWLEDEAGITVVRP